MTSAVLAALVLILGTIFRLRSLNGSLWQDEAWVANSVLAPTLRGMFFYPPWLQTSPPLFLVLERAAMLGLPASSLTLRLVPLALSVLALVFFFDLGRSLFPAPLLVLFLTLLWLSPPGIAYSTAVKPYGGELMVGCGFLAFTILGPPEFLLPAALLGLPLGYGTAVFLPGLLIAAVRWDGLRRGLLLAALAGAELLLLDRVFVRPNMSPALIRFWDLGHPHLPSLDTFSLLPQFLPLLIEPRLVIGVALALFVLSPFAFRDAKIPLALLPILVFLGIDSLGLYPLTLRTGLLLLPSILLMLLCGVLTLRALAARIRGEVFVDGAALVVVAWIFSTFCALPFTHRSSGEDYEGAVAYLKASVRGGERVLVHASCDEGFRLYARLLGLGEERAIYGNTGWPCCPRELGRLVTRDVDADVAASLPPNYRGRLYLLVTDRLEHWVFVGRDERPLLVAALRARGCLIRPAHSFRQVSLVPFDCGS